MVLESIRSTIPCSLSKNVDTRPVGTTKITSTTTALKKTLYGMEPAGIEQKKIPAKQQRKSKFRNIEWKIKSCVYKQMLE